MKTEVTTFDDDLLSLEDFADRLEQFIEVERQFVEKSLVISLGSKFGSGKTSFLKMWMDRMTKTHKDKGNPLVIYLNAWESDYYGDPLFAIVSALSEKLKKGDDQRKTSADNIINAAKTVGAYTVIAGKQFIGHAIEKKTGLSWKKSKKNAEAEQICRIMPFLPTAAGKKQCST